MFMMGANGVDAGAKAQAARRLYDADEQARLW